MGVIIGPEFYYDPVKNKFCVDKEKYFDINGRNGITDPSELEKYIINIYKIMSNKKIQKEINKDRIERELPKYDNVSASESKYTVLRNGIRVSDVEHESYQDAQVEYNEWKKILERWPDGSKLEIKKM